MRSNSHLARRKARAPKRTRRMAHGTSVAIQLLLGISLLQRSAVGGAAAAPSFPAFPLTNATVTDATGTVHRLDHLDAIAFIAAHARWRNALGPLTPRRLGEGCRQRFSLRYAANMRHDVVRLCVPPGRSADSPGLDGVFGTEGGQQRRRRVLQGREDEAQPAPAGAASQPRRRLGTVPSYIEGEGLIDLSAPESTDAGAAAADGGQASASPPPNPAADAVAEPLAAGESSVHCFLQHQRTRLGHYALCLSRNLLLHSCHFLARPAPADGSEGGGDAAGEQDGGAAGGGGEQGSSDGGEQAAGGDQGGDQHARRSLLDAHDLRYPTPTPGAVQLGCALHPTLAEEGMGPAGKALNNVHSRVWWQDAAQYGAGDAVASACADGASSVVSHPVAFVMRETYANLAHDQELLSALFIGLAVLDLEQVKQQGLEVAFVDHMPAGPFLHLWSRISVPYKLRFLLQDPFPPGTCFRTAIHLYSYSGGGAFNLDGSLASCPSPLVQAFTAWEWRLMHDLREEIEAAERQGIASGIIRRSVVWMSRLTAELLRAATSAGAPCNRPIECWEEARMITNEDEVVAAVLQTIQRWNQYSCLARNHQAALRSVIARQDGVAERAGLQKPRKRARRRLQEEEGNNQGQEQGSDEAGTDCRQLPVLFDFVYGNFAGEPFYPHQVATMSKAGVLMGVHGAALGHVLFTPLRQAAVVELAAERWRKQGALAVYKSIVNNMEGRYSRVLYDGWTVDVRELARELTKALDAVADMAVAAQLEQGRNTSQVHVRDNFNFQAPQVMCTAGAANATARD